MHLEEMSHWLWTCAAWVKAKFGLMDRALEDTGWLMQREIAVVAVTLGHTGRRSANLVVANQHSDGTLIKELLFPPCSSICFWIFFYIYILLLLTFVCDFFKVSCSKVLVEANEKSVGTF